MKTRQNFESAAISLTKWFCFLFSFTPFLATEFKPINEKKLTGDALLNKIPVEFRENKGQLRSIENKSMPTVFFKAEAKGLDLYVTDKGLLYVFFKIEKEKTLGNISNTQLERKSESIKVEYEKVDLEFQGAKISLENLIKETESLTSFNYRVDKNSYLNVKSYKKLTFKNIYPGIDWVLYNSSQEGFKYDFIVYPEADPSNIKMLYKATKALVMDSQGNIILENPIGSLKEKAPYTYVLSNKKFKHSAFKIEHSSCKNGIYTSVVGITVNKIADQTLVIDPQLVWSTFYGGSSWEGTTCLDIDSQGNVYMTGYTASLNIPLNSSGTYFQSASASAFILKFANSGTMLWATYYGGTGSVNATYLDCDANDNVFICGQLTSTVGFNLVNSGSYFQNVAGGGEECFISKFDPFGNCLWSTYFGGDGNDRNPVCSTDMNGNVFVVGVTNSTVFPLQNAGTYFDNTAATTASTNTQGFVTKFSNSGNLLWSTFVKGIIDGVVVATDINGNIYLTGQAQAALATLNPGNSAYFQGVQASNVDAFLMKFDNIGNQLWSTYYGGTGLDRGYSLACDKSGNLFVVGITTSINFPTQNAGTFYQASQFGLADIFLLKFNSIGVRQWGTYFGGTRNESLMNSDNIAIDTCGNLYFGCTTVSRNMPTVSACDAGFFDSSLDTILNTNHSDIYLAKFSNNGALSWGTYLGGAGRDFRTNLGLDNASNLFVTGEWVPGSSSLTPTYPLVNGGLNTYNSTYFSDDDLYICKFSKGLPPQGFSYGTYCMGSTNTATPALTSSFLSGGTFSSQAGLSLNNNNGQINLLASNPGVYSVNYYYQTCNCGDTGASILSSATVTILAAPIVSVSGQFTVCVNEKRTYTASGANFYVWSTAALSPTISVTAPTQSTTLLYHVSGTGVNGCTSSTNFSVYVRPCVSIPEYLEASNGIKIYPNPNSGEFTIESEFLGEFELINSAGQLIQTLQFNAQNNQRVFLKIDANGIYFLRTKEEGSLNTWKIIVENQ